MLREHADDDVYSRRMNGPSVYIKWKPRADLQLIANYRYMHSTYDQVMTYFPEHREDKQSTADLTALSDIRRFTGLNSSEEYTSELQSLMRHSYDVRCFKKK